MLGRLGCDLGMCTGTLAGFLIAGICRALVCALVRAWDAQVVELSIECTELGHVFISAVTDWLGDNRAMHREIHRPIGDVINSVRIVDGTAMLCKISEFGDTEIQLCNIAGYTKLDLAFLLMSSCADLLR